MKIAMMVRAYIPIPRPADMVYAPIDLALAVAQGLTERGHDVTFFCCNGSSGSTGSVKVKIETLGLRPLVHNQNEFKDFRADVERLTHYVPEMWDKYLTLAMLQRAQAGDFDITWFHHAENALDIAHLFPTVPIIYTVHDPFYPWLREIIEMFESPNQHLISISDNQRRDATDLPYIATVHNGISLEQWPISTACEDYLLFAGRITPEKGVKEAIQVAKATNHRLLIVGPVHPGESQEYFDQYIKPQLDDQILHLGFVEREQMWRYYQKALAVLTPIQWEEPFGLTTIEAMACGTPVISLDRGAAPEIIKDGKTGFIVRSISEMIDAVGKIHTIDRLACREHVRRNFSTQQMVSGYEKAFQQVLEHKAHTKTTRSTAARPQAKTVAKTTAKAQNKPKTQKRPPKAA